MITLPLTRAELLRTTRIADPIEGFHDINHASGRPQASSSTVPSEPRRVAGMVQGLQSHGLDVVRELTR